MSFQLIIKPLAERDLSECYTWYDEQKRGLGDDLLKEVEHCLETIIRNPLQYQVRYKKVRMMKVKRFPICLHYTVDQDTVFVLAVLSTHRNPQAWIRRSST